MFCQHSAKCGSLNYHIAGWSPAGAGRSRDRAHMIYNIYVLKSLKDLRFYIGSTGDIKSRLKSHKEGLVRSTKNRRPLKLVYTETFKTRSEAIKREKFLKRQKGGDVFKRIINNHRGMEQ
ncbi:MAG: GIY-YIG nuclease family protein [Patescibacteria group bacterium]